MRSGRSPSNPYGSFLAFSLLVAAFAVLFFPTRSLAKKKEAAEQPIQVLDEPTATPTVTATPTPLSQPRSISNNTNSKTLILHKPATNPAWGRVVEYHKENALSTADKTPETLHVFLFQDDQAIVRTAIYHESSSGDGYWEVFVWDR